MNRISFVTGLVFLSVTAVAQVNIAPLGTATQISNWSSSAHAGKANDGNRDGRFNNGSVSHTQSSMEAWWRVAFDQDHIIQQVNIWNRTDSFGGRLNPFEITLFLDGNIVWQQSQITFSDTIDDGLAYTAGMSFSVPGVLADSLQVNLDGHNNYLQLAEVEAINAVPEPATLAVLGLGSLALLRKRKRVA